METTNIPTVGVIIFKSDCVLLVKHKAKANHLTNTYGLPGGRIIQKESLKTAAARELKEETGLITETKYLKEYSKNRYIAVIKRKYGTQKFSMTVFICFRFKGTLVETEETKPVWLKFAQLDSYNLLPNVKKALNDALKHFRPEIILIAAIGENRELGKNNQLLWQIPEDLKRFKKLTTGHVVIMGRKTFESIGKPLPNRTNIIISANKNYTLPSAYVCHSFEDALKQAKVLEKQEIFVIGGGQIYKEAMPYVDKLYLTIVKATADADTFFPDYSEFKTVILKQEGQYNTLRYTFLGLMR